MFSCIYYLLSVTESCIPVGSVYDKYANTKSVRKGIKLTNIPEKEDQLTSKEVHKATLV